MKTVKLFAKVWPGIVRDYYMLILHTVTKSKDTDTVTGFYLSNSFNQNGTHSLDDSTTCVYVLKHKGTVYFQQHNNISSNGWHDQGFITHNRCVFLIHFCEIM